MTGCRYILQKAECFAVGVRHRSGQRFRGAMVMGKLDGSRAGERHRPGDGQAVRGRGEGGRHRSPAEGHRRRPDLLERRKEQLGPAVLSREAKMAARSATVGARAPDFSLPVTTGPGSERRLASLADHQDRWLMLLFYPRDFSLV